MAETAVSCLFSLGVSLLWKVIQTKIKCNIIQGVVIPSKGGCSKLVDSVAVSDKYVVLDLNENIKLNLNPDELKLFESIDRNNASFTIHIFPLYKKYIEKVKKDFKGKQIIVLASSAKELEYCGINRIHIYIPNTEFSNIINCSLESDKSSQDVFNKSRMDLLLSTKEKKRTIYESFDSLKKEFVARYKVEIKI